MALCQAADRFHLSNPLPDGFRFREAREYFAAQKYKSTTRCMLLRSNERSCQLGQHFSTFLFRLPRHGSCRHVDQPLDSFTYMQAMKRRHAPRAGQSSERPGDQENGRSESNANQGDSEVGSTSGKEYAPDNSGPSGMSSDSTGVSHLRLPKVAKVEKETIGGSRFDVAVRAMKGDFDPPTAAEDTEKRTLLEALVQFPSFYTFSVVGKVETTSEEPGKVFTKDTLETVERICGTKLATSHYSVRVKAGGKYISMRITTLVQSADLVKATYDELLKDGRVIMAY